MASNGLATFYRWKSLLPQNLSNAEISHRRPRVYICNSIFLNIIFIFPYNIHEEQQQQHNNCSIIQSESKSVENRCYIFVQGDLIAFYGWIMAYTFPIIAYGVATASFDCRHFALKNFLNYRYQQPLDTPYGIRQTKFESREKNSKR